MFIIINQERFKALLYFKLPHMLYDKTRKHLKPVFTTNGYGTFILTLFNVNLMYTKVQTL